ncbi:hypothetical protein DNK71_22000 [Klebsiella pneumoniae]|nr:hypothetical protein DNK71_22000 [Klebsiella pneumoniae]
MLKKTALSCAASPFAAVPQRDCHQHLSSHPPANPTPPASRSPFPLNNTQTPLKLISNVSHYAHPNHSTQPNVPHPSPISTPNYSPNPTYHHSHIFQKVLANAFLLFIRSRSCVLISSIFL